MPYLCSVKRTMNIYFRYAIVCLLWLAAVGTHAQSIYPVQVFTHLTPPYTPFTPDYYSAFAVKEK
ncbi:MAG: hypothetical protein LBH04_04895, partial [Tannerellaceae bacterium]|nr:hypothetical protein [Tannerellaceae bacterium]